MPWYHHKTETIHSLCGERRRRRRRVYELNGCCEDEYNTFLSDYVLIASTTRDNVMQICNATTNRHVRRKEKDRHKDIAIYRT